MSDCCGKPVWKEYYIIAQIDYPVKARTEEEAERKALKELEEKYGWEADIIGIIRPES